MKPFKRNLKTLVQIASLALLQVSAACQGAGPGSDEGTSAADESEVSDTRHFEDKAATTLSKRVFVIAFENHDANAIYGNSSQAPYINGTLMPKYARSTRFADVLPNDMSEPHYLWMEAGTRTFSDHKFTSNDDASSTNSTSSTAHLVTQIKNSGSGLTWMSYQEGLNSSTGSCPIRSSGFYAAKHNPFVFFQDVAGSPPSRTNAYCSAHHKPMSALASDLANGSVASFNFLTPDLCNSMHGASGCPSGSSITVGDNWLRRNLPPIIDYVNRNGGVIFLTWDEGDSTNTIPFLAIGPNVKTGHASSANHDHSSMLKSIEKILGLPILGTVANASELTDLFASGYPGTGTGDGDLCPNDPNKTAPGTCGCGVREPVNVSGYRDAQGFACTDWEGYNCSQAAEQYGFTAAQETSILANCALSCKVCAPVVDQCPNDPAKTTPGLCGCGVPEGTCTQGPTVSMSKSTYAVNESIVVNFSGAAGSSTDWVGLYASGAANTSDLIYKYTGGGVSGRLTFTGRGAGNYEARMFFNDNYTLKAKVSFSVR